MHISTLALPLLSLLGSASAAPNKSPRDTTTTLSARADFHPGWCGVHVAQTVAANQDDWLITARIFDGEQVPMGNVAGEYVPGDGSIQIKSDVPERLEIIPRRDAVSFRYGGDEWKSTNDRCSMGKWDGPEGMKIRHMDCGFNC